MPLFVVNAVGGWRPRGNKTDSGCLLEVRQNIQLWIFAHEWAPVCTLGWGESPCVSVVITMSLCRCFSMCLSVCLKYS